MCNEGCGFPCEEVEHSGGCCEIPTEEERERLKMMVETRPFVELFSNAPDS